MPRLTTPTTTLIRRSSHLPATSPIRLAARDELARLRASWCSCAACRVARGAALAV